MVFDLIKADVDLKDYDDINAIVTMIDLAIDLR